jgi:hypothetical protein
VFAVLLPQRAFHAELTTARLKFSVVRQFVPAVVRQTRDVSAALTSARVQEKVFRAKLVPESENSSRVERHAAKNSWQNSARKNFIVKKSSKKNTGADIASIRTSAAVPCCE